MSVTKVYLCMKYFFVLLRGGDFNFLIWYSNSLITFCSYTKLKKNTNYDIFTGVYIVSWSLILPPPQYFKPKNRTPF